jgi:phosphate transport system substrate-binding protein
MPTTSPTEIPYTVPPISLATMLYGVWPRIDGSTATIPLTAAMHEYFGAPGNPPKHNTTPNAYSNLCRGNSDIIFVTRPSENELVEARERGIELEVIPIVKDALVFLANAENPVDGATLSQIRDIYVGKIKNWKTLGGLDEEIIAYQRPDGSGSQTLMTELLMNGIEPMYPPTDWLIEAMGMLIEVVANFENSRDAIGYSVFYYVNDMYASDRFKLLAVDGIKPTRDTITRGEYPLEDYYYAVIRKNEPAGNPVRKLVAWLLTDEGQDVAASAGYIPLREVENTLPAKNSIPSIYLGDSDNSAGTGGKETLSRAVVEELISSGARIPLSDIFYDGFNFIRYINDEIVSDINSPGSTYWYSEYPDRATTMENETRPFTGIPNDYPHYELSQYWDGEVVVLIITLPDDNPFFEDQRSFHIYLKSDISPFGTKPNDLTVSYHRDRNRLLLSKATLITISVNLSGKPEISKRINERLEAWTDAFGTGGEKDGLLSEYVEWCTKRWDGDWDVGFGQPSYGRWENYLSVSYFPHVHDGPSTYMPLLYAICFDTDTGEVVDLANCLPPDIPYSQGMAFKPLTTLDAGELTGQTLYENYAPPKGSEVTYAWIYSGSLNLLVDEPDGRQVQVCIDNWERIRAE